MVWGLGFKDLGFRGQGGGAAGIWVERFRVWADPDRSFHLS